jgi:hypothetical protein
MSEKPTILIQFINYVWYLLHVSALNCHLQGAFLVRITPLDPNTPVHNILSTAPQLSISQMALGTLPDEGNVIPKHVGATINN